MRMAEIQEYLKSETYDLQFPLSKQANVFVSQTPDRKKVSLALRNPPLVLDVTPGYHTQDRKLSSLESRVDPNTPYTDPYVSPITNLPKLFPVPKAGASKEEMKDMLLQQIAYLQQLYASLSPEIQDRVKQHLQDASGQTEEHMDTFYDLSQTCQPGLEQSRHILPSCRKSLHKSLDAILGLALGWELLREMSKKQAEYLVDDAIYLHRHAKTPFGKTNAQNINSLSPFYHGIEEIANALLLKIDASVRDAVEHSPAYGSIKKEVFSGLP